MTIVCQAQCPGSLIYSRTAASCGQQNGSITVSYISGIPPYTYSIDSINFQTSNVFNNLAPSVYQLIVRDANNCQKESTVPIPFDRTNIWTGAIDSLWENPLNWSCGRIPDSTSAVFIYSGPVVLNSNTTIYSLTIYDATITILSGFNLSILQP